MVVVWERVGDGHGRGYLYGTVKEAVLSERTRSPDLDTVGVFDRFASILCPCIVRNRDPGDPRCVTAISAKCHLTLWPPCHLNRVSLNICNKHVVGGKSATNMEKMSFEPTQIARSPSDRLADRPPSDHSIVATPVPLRHIKIPLMACQISL